MKIKFFPFKDCAKVKLFLFFIGVFISNLLFADHYYGGYFYYERLADKTYQVSLVTYTDHHNTTADRDSVLFYWGDNSSSYLIRQNADGEEIYPEMKKSLYIGSHTYANYGNYRMYFSDDWRLFDLANMAFGKSGSTNLRFEGVVPVQDSTQYCQNSAPIPLCEPYFYGVENQELSLNFCYFDQEGDSIFYELSPNLDATGNAAEGYFVPEGASINSTTGQFTWTAPKKGLYCFAFTIIEYRNGELLGKSSTDFTLFISQGEYPKLPIGSGGISSGTTDNTYRFSVAGSKEFTFVITHSSNPDSVRSEFISPLFAIPEFNWLEKKSETTTQLKDTLILNYAGGLSFNGYYPVNWQVTSYFGSDSIVIQQFPLMIAVESPIIWDCEIPDISDIHEETPVIKTLDITPSLFEDYVWINIGNDYSNCVIYVYDTRGRLVKFYNQLEQSTVKLELFDLSSAMYILQVVQNDKVIFNGKMVKR